jgi:outer membrane protein assembly factor BamB
MAPTYTRRTFIAGAGSLAAAALLPAAQGEDWPQFRGAARDNIGKETGLAHRWPAAGPKVLWSVPVAQGYAGAAIVGGRVYHQDYDEAKSEWCVNCRSMADGKLLWQFREAREIRPNHAITRTVPAVDARFLFSLDPKAVLHCLDVKTGKQVWRKSLVTEYKTMIPSWYNGQCPLMEPDRLIVATGGAAIMVALDKATGKEIWRTPNASRHPMSHA